MAFSGVGLGRSRFITSSFPCIINPKRYRAKRGILSRNSLRSKGIVSLIIGITFYLGRLRLASSPSVILLAFYLPSFPSSALSSLLENTERTFLFLSPSIWDSVCFFNKYLGDSRVEAVTLFQREMDKRRAESIEYTLRARAGSDGSIETDGFSLSSSLSTNSYRQIQVFDRSFIDATFLRVNSKKRCP